MLHYVYVKTYRVIDIIYNRDTLGFESVCYDVTLKMVKWRNQAFRSYFKDYIRVQLKIITALSLLFLTIIYIQMTTI